MVDETATDPPANGSGLDGVAPAGMADLGNGLLDSLAGFVGELRTAGIPVSLTENLDAMEALLHVPMEDREAFKYALAATMVKNEAHWKAFETVFEVFFSFRGSEYGLGDGTLETKGDDNDSLVDSLMGSRPGEGGHGEGMTAEQLAAMLYKALMDGNDSTLRAMARAAVTRYAGMEPGRPVGGTYYIYRTLRQLDLDAVLERMIADDNHGGDDQGPSELEERLLREEYESRLAKLRREVEAEIRRRLVADRGAEAVAKSVRKPLPEDIDFMHANREELVALRRAIGPLTRRLAVRLARKRRHGRRGALDFRSTVRHSLSYGGVPADLRFRDPRPAKPEIMVVADISGSVAAFARFTLQLVYAISSQFSRVRSFVFIDGIDEVTDYFKATDDIGEAIHRINTEADVIWVDGHSDYGHAFEAFWERWGSAITTKTTVLFLGDARNNYHASQAWVLAEVAKKARHVFWLNPEPRSYWDTGDSIASQYGVHCEGSYECRNLKQLERFVDQLG
ncbi:MAG: VWA domain-containing protein [Actinomycetota bacterium]|nr:VWA domain-containing protein [Actinomycetota bacterium]